MNKIKIVLFSLVFFMLMPFMVSAQGDYYVQDNGSERSVEHSLFTAGQVVNSQEIVNGINFVAGNSIKIDGENEYGFYAGNDVTISNSVIKDVFVAGNNVIITNNANIGRDLYGAGTSITINANVSNNAFIAGSLVTLKDAIIDGDLNIICDKLVIEGVVSINGTMSINSDAIIDNENSLMVNNKNVYNIDRDYEFSITNIFVEFLISIASIMLVGFIINSMFPKVFDKLIKNLSLKNEAKNIGVGLITLIVIPIISIILMCTIVGVRLGFILALLYILLLLISILFASCVVGNLILTKLFKSDNNSYLAIVIGVILFKLISLLPIGGSLIYFLAILYGLGKFIELYKNKDSE